MSSASNNRTTNLEQNSSPPRRSLRLSFSLGSMLVITVVVAFLGAILSQLFRSLMEPTPTNVGYFALAAAVGPSAILIVAGSVFKVLGWLKLRQQRQAAQPIESDF